MPPEACRQKRKPDKREFDSSGIAVGDRLKRLSGFIESGSGFEREDVFIRVALRARVHSHLNQLRVGVESGKRGGVRVVQHVFFDRQDACPRGLRGTAGFDKQVVHRVGLIGLQFRIVFDGLRAFDDDGILPGRANLRGGRDSEVCAGQSGVIGDVGHQCAQNHPHHKRDVEVNERGEQRGRVSTGFKFSQVA